MKSDLTNDLESAMCKRGDWSLGDVQEVLSVLQGYAPESNVDWEVGDENWARLLFEGEVVAIVSSIAPIGFVQSRLSAQVNGGIKRCQIIIVSSFSDNLYRLDKSTVSKFAEREVSDNVDFTSISIDDLWWATV